LGIADTLYLIYSIRNIAARDTADPSSFLKITDALVKAELILVEAPTGFAA